MEKYFFSPSTLGFYPESMFDLYIAAGTLPEDIVEVTDEEYSEYSGQPPLGKTRGVKDGKPAWVDLPPPSDSEVIAHNEVKKQQLISEASRFISILTDATDPDVMGDGILPEDIESLKQWKAYRVKLNRITDMLNPVWPDKPE